MKFLNKRNEDVVKWLDYILQKYSSDNIQNGINTYLKNQLNCNNDELKDKLLIDYYDTIFYKQPPVIDLILFDIYLLLGKKQFLIIFQRSLNSLNEFMNYFYQVNYIENKYLDHNDLEVLFKDFDKLSLLIWKLDKKDLYNFAKQILFEELIQSSLLSKQGKITNNDYDIIATRIASINKSLKSRFKNSESLYNEKIEALKEYIIYPPL